MKVVITGGAGFIGSNSTIFNLKKKRDVTIIDNFSRVGSESNLKWIKSQSKKTPKVIRAHVENDLEVLKKEISDADLVIHLAGQVAVTTSVINPLNDFRSNALGTINVLEAVRSAKKNPVLIYSSTNKVYGELENEEVVEKKKRYEFKKLKHGVSESMPVDFHSPYGCSKGSADQYVRDYARIYGLRTVVFRQSCIYGPRQFGVEDQGWLAWFIIAIMKGTPITIYGNGKQVRDILYVDDLVNAYETAYKKIDKASGQIFNIGGGTRNVISIWEDFRPILEDLFGREISAKYSEWRPGDQPIFVSDIRKIKKVLGWEPKTNVNTGIKKLHKWITTNKKLFS